jgi:hypothetical protein
MPQHSRAHNCARHRPEQEGEACARDRVGCVMPAEMNGADDDDRGIDREADAEPSRDPPR